jgi:hypothetical protein
MRSLRSKHEKAAEQKALTGPGSRSAPSKEAKPFKPTRWMDEKGVIRKANTQEVHDKWLKDPGMTLIPSSARSKLDSPQLQALINQMEQMHRAINTGSSSAIKFQPGQRIQVHQTKYAAEPMELHADRIVGAVAKVLPDDVEVWAVDSVDEWAAGEFFAYDPTGQVQASVEAWGLNDKAAKEALQEAPVRVLDALRSKACEVLSYPPGTPMNVCMEGLKMNSLDVHVWVSGLHKDAAGEWFLACAVAFTYNVDLDEWEPPSVPEPPQLVIDFDAPSVKTPNVVTSSRMGTWNSSTMVPTVLTMGPKPNDQIAVLGRGVNDQWIIQNAGSGQSLAISDAQMEDLVDRHDKYALQQGGGFVPIY